MKILLIVIDFQNDFVSGSLGFPEAAALETGIVEKIHRYRERGDDVAFTYDTHGEDYAETQEGKRLPIPHCIKGSEGWALYGGVARLLKDTDRQFFKPGFGSAELFDFLRGSDYEAIELVGLVSSICVISNAVLAKTALPEAEIIVDAACTAGADKHLHEAALDVMAGIQITVINRE